MSADVLSTTDVRADTSTPAVVLKLDPNVMHHGGLGVIRSLGRLGVPVYGVHEGPSAPAAASRYLHGRWFWQPDPADPHRVTAGLLRVARRIGRRAVLIPTDDAGAIFLAEHGGGLREWFAFPATPAALPRRLAGKYSMYEMCRALDVPCPKAVIPGSLGEAREFAADTGFPVIAKLTTPWQPGSGLRSTTIARDQAGLDASYLAAPAGDLMLQEFIPGGRGDDWFFHGYCDTSSACQPAFTGVKQRSYPAHAGLTSLGVSARNPRLRGEVTRLLKRLGYRGIVDLDLRFDARDGTYKLLDFNPRLGAQFMLLRDTAGLDVVRAQYLDLTGGAPPGWGDQVDGRSFLVENYDPISAMSYWQAGELRLRDWAASVRGADETAWFARDDLRPFGLMCVHMASHAITRTLPGKGRRGVRRFTTEPRYRPGRAGGKQHEAQLRDKRKEEQWV